MVKMLLINQQVLEFTDFMPTTECACGNYQAW